ncbi:hypothetical protein [Actinocrispum wychmicini]|uniref:Uncharacterized protein n=1 Tax=Actinocrispum wychmicini TaxID=1213861 RepID=A0A4R2K0F5_9PSEU|nr:hypothetical protein [Actinocrispum wychmicini]TCO65754.1 hypothetical protein EV192_1011546 [Actinocrispum wychmicini]
MNDANADRRPRRVWLPATAAVLALVVSGSIALVRHGDAPPKRDYHPTVVRLAVNSREVTAQLDRCWRTARELSTMAKYPDRSEWRPVLAVKGGELWTVTAIRTNGRPLFCETVIGGTTLSSPDADPVYAPGTRTAAMLTTNAGTVAGVVDPSWPDMRVRVVGRYQDDIEGRAVQQDGLFVYPSYLSAVDDRVTVGQDGDPRIPLPPAPQPYGVVNPSYSSSDRSSTAGRHLGDCIAKSGEPDSDGWSPAATVQANDERLILAVNPAGVGACLQQAQGSRFMPYVSRAVSAAKPELLSLTATVGGRQVVAGILPQGAADMRLTLADGTTLDADVDRDTFAALLPLGVTDTHGMTAKLAGNSRQILYVGPLT